MQAKEIRNTGGACSSCKKNHRKVSFARFGSCNDYLQLPS
jgi:hypothetical protein